MRLNITSEQVPLEEFKEMLEKSSNIKDVYFLCNQAGCPVYIVRNIENKCQIVWHPSIDRERDVIKMVYRDGVVEFRYKEKVQVFDNIEDLQRDTMSKYMLGDNPFDSDYLVWSKNDILNK